MVSPGDTMPTPAITPGGFGPGRKFGPYMILQELGRGGMGVVYLAEHVDLGRRVALKVLAAHYGASEKGLERFEREIKAVARLRDPNIVPIYDVGRIDGVPYFTMEYVEGITLHDVLLACRSRGAAAANLAGRDLFDSAFEDRAVEHVAPAVRGSWVHAACHVVAHIADALSHVHAQGIIHRDVKPKNILLARDGRVLLFDFGLARVESEAAMTVTGEFLGTPYYVSPEQLDAPAGGIDERADVYSLGVTLYEILTLQVPFDGDSPQQIFRRIGTRAVRPPRRLNPDVPRDLETVCLVAMARERSRRYPSAADFAADLRRFLEWKPVFARPVGPVQRLALWVRRKPAVAALLVAFVLLAVALGFNWQQGGVLRAERRAHALASFTSAQLLAQQGRFRAALGELANAAAGGHDPVAVELVRIEALEATGQEELARAALTALRQRRDLGAHAPAVDLLAADMGVERLREPDAGLDLAQRAIESGALSPADASYARALLATDGREALDALRATLFASPYHRRARESLVPTLLGLGLHADAVEFAQHLRATTLEDPYAHLAAAAAHALQGDLEQAIADLGVVERRLDAGGKAALDAWAGQLAVLARAPTDLLAAVLQGRTDLAGASLRVLGSVSALAAGIDYVTADGEHRRLRFRLPPALARGYAGMVQAMAVRFAGNDDGVTAREQESLRVLLGDSLSRRPDGFRHFLRGVVGFQCCPLPEVLADLDAAVVTPSIVRIARPAAFLGLRARLFVLGAGAVPESDVVRAQLRTAVAGMVAVGAIEPGAYPLLLEAAQASGDPDLALEIAVRWRRELPEAAIPEALRRGLDAGLRRQEAWIHGRR